MPINMTSKGRLPDSQLSSIPSKAVKDLYKSTKPATSEQLHGLKRVDSSIHKTPEELRKPQELQFHDGKEPLRITANPPSRDVSGDVTKEIWPCRLCSCGEGIFRGLVNSCIVCKHGMDNHSAKNFYPWDPACDFLCERKDLVSSVMQRVRQYGVVVIRATPQVGKSALLKLLGHRIVHQELDLEPVYVIWENREKRKNVTCEDYLNTQAAVYRKKNTTIRPCNPEARSIFLIDEAQGSYEEEHFWTHLKNHHQTRQQSLYVLVCVYGAVGISRMREPNVESQALQMHSLQRIELRSSTPGAPCMLFRPEEVDIMVRKFATYVNLQLEPGVAEYLYHATDGHPGMIGLLLGHWTLFYETVSLDRLPRSFKLC